MKSLIKKKMNLIKSFDLFKKYKKISRYLKSTKKENNDLIKGLRNSFRSKLDDIKKILELW